MEEKIKARIMDARKIKRAFLRMTHEIIEHNRDLKRLVIVGIRTRGVFVAKRIAKLIHDFEGVEIPVGVLDITLYRDDFSHISEGHVVKKTEIDFSIDKKDVLLVDDVLFTGRTVRAAMDSLIDLGRPRTVHLLVFIDRGHRELPIRPDFVGKNVPTSPDEEIRVKMIEEDEVDAVYLVEVEKQSY